jgi:hypothetical protein
MFMSIMSMRLFFLVLHKVRLHKAGYRTTRVLIILDPSRVREALQVDEMVQYTRHNDQAGSWSRSDAQAIDG